MEQKALDILSKFDLPGRVLGAKQFGNGHINWTYDVEMDDGSRYVLQRINTYVFRDPVGLMRNIELLTNFMLEKVEDPRSVLRLIKTYDGKTYTVTEDNECWRVYDFVDSICYDAAESLELFRECGAGFGSFQNLLSDFPVEQLVETIPNFHNTVSRYADFEQAVREDRSKRSANVKRDIDYAMSERDFAPFFLDKQAAGGIPLRVTHNDTKINNVLFDKNTNKALCVVDLDTTMPGFAAIDFGDCIRYSASGAPEDEQNLDEVFLHMDLFKAFAEGFCGTAAKNLTAEELLLCPEAAKLVTIETGIRFLGDYLNGDVYFHIDYPDQNLARARAQFKLASDMDARMEDMRDIIKRVID